MTTAQILVTVMGLALSVFIAWFFWFAPKTKTQAAVSASGAQEVAVTVKGGYTPWRYAGSYRRQGRAARAPALHAPGKFGLLGDGALPRLQSKRQTAGR